MCSCLCVKGDVVQFGLVAGRVELGVDLGDDVGGGVGVASADPGADGDVGDVDAVLLQDVVEVEGPVPQPRGGDVDVGQERDGRDGAAAGGDEDGAGVRGEHVVGDLGERV